MPRRRNKGQGSIRLTDAGTYEARAVIGYKDPLEKKNPIRQTKTFQLKGDAERWLAEKRLEFGDIAHDISPTLTVSEWLTMFLDMREKEISASNYHKHEYYLKKHLEPYLGSIRLRDVDELKLKRWSTRLKVELTKDTYSRTMKLTKKFFKTAVELGLIRYSPAQILTDIAPPKPKMRHRWTNLEVKLAAKFSQESGMFYPYVHLALVSGMRREELLGLRWSDIDFVDGCLFVRQVVVYVRRKWEMKEATKTEDSYRRVYLDTETLKILQDFQRKQKLEPKRSNWVDHDLLFPGEKGTPPHEKTLVNKWYKFCDAAQVRRIWLIDLRSTYVSLSDGKIPDKVGAERAGHSLDMRRNVYRRTVEEEHRAAALSLGQLVSQDNK